MAARWKVICYRDERGRKPVQQFLDDLVEKKHRLEDATKLTEKFTLLEDYGFHQALSVELLKGVEGEDKLFALKVKGTELRVCLFLWTHPKGRRCMVLAAAELKKQWKLSREMIDRAKRARADWFRRHPGGEPQ